MKMRRHRNRTRRHGAFGVETIGARVRAPRACSRVTHGEPSRSFCRRTAPSSGAWSFLTPDSRRFDAASLRHDARLLSPARSCAGFGSGGMSISRPSFGVGTLAIGTAGLGGATPSPAFAATIQASDPRAATCGFWGGRRTMGADKSAVTVPGGTTGLCDNPQSPLHDRPTRPDQVFQNGYRRRREIG